jgi:hypothetical protein
VSLVARVELCCFFARRQEQARDEERARKAFEEVALQAKHPALGPKQGNADEELFKVCQAVVVMDTNELRTA